MFKLGARINPGFLFLYNLVCVFCISFRLKNETSIIECHLVDGMMSMSVCRKIDMNYK